jgi:hypothetical protein
MSLPIRVVLVFPIMTPSGLHMGTILKIKRLRSSLDTRDRDMRKLIRPCMIQEDAVSPG